MNADIIIGEIREAVDEPGANYYTNDLILSAVNQVYYELAWDMKLCKRTTNHVDSSSATQNAVASAADSPIHLMPSDWMKIDSRGQVWWQESSTDSRKLTGKSWAYAVETGLLDSYNTSGTPIIYILDQHDLDYYDDAGYANSVVISVYPYPDAIGNKLKIPYIAQPVALESTLTETSPAAAATSPVFTARFHRVLVWEVVVQKLMKRRKINDAMAIETKYLTPIREKMAFYYKGNKTMGEPKSFRKATRTTRSPVENTASI